MTTETRHEWGRNARAAWRDTLLLLRQFAWPLLLFALAVAGGGALYSALSRGTAQAVGWVEGAYTVLSATFLQPLGDFPDAWYLQAFYFAMPVIGLAILAYGLTDFGTMLFNRRARNKEWEMAVASTFQHHVVLVGLGHLGFRVMRALHDLGQDVVVITLDPAADLLGTARRMGIPVVQDDARREESLLGAGIPKAKTIVLCTQNDVLNLQVAFKARRLNPGIEVVIRIFEDQFADEVGQQFGYRALSATSMAAPMFAAAASGIDITPPITVEGQALSLASFEVRPRSGFIGRSVGEIEGAYNVSVVLLRKDGVSDFHPAAGRCLEAGDAVAVLGGQEALGQVTAANQ
jgi:Trk K+ transport system NAD-binding subunit